MITSDPQRTKTWVAMGSVFFFMLIASLAILSRGTYGGADDMVHYQFSRYAWGKPELLLDHWAKPFYTLLASLFARFGFNGVRVMNALFATLSAYMVFRFQHSRGLPYSGWGLLLCITSPLYFMMAGTGMTEILFGFMLLMATLLFIRRKYSVSMLLLSFLPFVRTEAVVFFPVFLVALAIVRDWKPLLLLPAGFIIYSLAGYSTYDDLWWVINRMPYTGARDIYGQGSLFHFAGEAHRIFGIPLLVFFLWGMVRRLSGLLSRKKAQKAEEFLWFLLVYLSPLVYFTAHSVVWWQGWGGSLGLPRVMTVIVPVMSIGAAEGIFFLIRLIKRSGWPAILLQLVTAVVLIWQLTAWYDHPTMRDAETDLVYRACQWIKKEGYDSRKIYYYNPFVPYYLGINPWDTDRSWEKVPDPENPGGGIGEGEIVIWDSHFGPNEGRLPAETLDRDSSLILLRVFEPDLPFTVLGNEPYQIKMYMKKNGSSGGKNGNT